MGAANVLASCNELLLTPFPVVKEVGCPWPAGRQRTLHPVFFLFFLFFFAVMFFVVFLTLLGKKRLAGFLQTNQKHINKKTRKI